jgi:pyruvate formate-lyase activating enzyme-like uncharacterized protein
MDALQARERLVEGNEREYGALSNYMNWIDAARAGEAHEERNALLRTAGVRVSCLGTKIHHGPLSPGCRQCAVKAWSCLFVSGRCNGRCFYCPTPQDTEDPPMAGTVAFHRPQDYADYVRLFGFGGASISGGEPLLDFDRSLEFVRALRRTCGPGLHIWLYTNGILATEKKLRLLAEAGLDEIRFDIGATDYALKAVKLARGVIPTVTVEIPAVPEEQGRLEGLLGELSEAGVSHLNLHQLRLTPHNARHLLERDYTFVHGPKVTVLESELCALALVASAAKSGLPLAVNYCSFVYKHRFQAAASRNRFGPWLLADGEELTAGGFIRTLQTRSREGSTWRTVQLPPPPGQELWVRYSAAFLRPAAGSDLIHRVVPVSEDFHIVLERRLAREPRPIELQELKQSLRAPEPDETVPGLYAPNLEDSCEWIIPGLGVYF